jgi:hypothetical protein
MAAPEMKLASSLALLGKRRFRVFFLRVSGCLTHRTLPGLKMKGRNGSAEGRIGESGAMKIAAWLFARPNARLQR